MSNEAISVLPFSQRQQALAWASGESMRALGERLNLYVHVTQGLLKAPMVGWANWYGEHERCEFALGLEPYVYSGETSPFAAADAEGVLRRIPADEVRTKWKNHPLAQHLAAGDTLLVFAVSATRGAGIALFAVIRRDNLLESESAALSALISLIAGEVHSATPSGPLLHASISRPVSELRKPIEEPADVQPFYRQLVHQLPGRLLFVFDRALTLRLADGAVCFPGTTGDPRELVGRCIRELNPLGEADELIEACEGALRGEQSLILIHLANRDYELRTAPLTDGGAILHGIALIHDVGQLDNFDISGRLFSAQLRTLVDSLDAGIVIEDAMQNVHYCNQHFCNLMQLSEPPRAMIGKTSAELIERIGPAFFIPEALEERISELKSLRQSSRDELVYLADMRILERSYAPLELDGQGLGHLWTYRDVTDRERNKDLLQRQADELRALSLVDELTGLYNRRGFLTLATQQLKLCDRSMRSALLVFVDLDGMKRINDELGHEYGDQALVETASVLRQCFRYSDVVARLGGDEFVVLAVEADPPTGDLVVERLYERLAEMNAKPERKFTLNFSVGITPYDPSKLEMVEEVLARADSLMYEQKRLRKMERKG